MHATGQTRDAIVGGRAASASELHSTVALVDDMAQFCTGTLISETVVLTATHCLKHQDPETGAFTTPYGPTEVSVVAGALDANAAISDALPVFKVATSGFDGETNPDAGDEEGLGKADDIAILLLDSPLTSLPAAPIVAAANLDAELTPGVELTISGYGLTDSQGSSSGVLHIGETEYLRRNSHELLAGMGGKDACPGDSGGPAYLLAAGSVRVVGVTSRGADNAGDCGEGGIWTLAPAYEQWIIDNSEGEYQPATQPPPNGGDGAAGDDDGCRVSAAAGAPSRSWPLWWAAVALLAARWRRRA